MPSGQPARRRFEVTWITIHVETGGHPRCPACAEPLDLHQPDQAAPARLLATCPSCGRWHLMEFTYEDGTALLLTLPEHSSSLATPARLRRVQEEAADDDPA